MTVVHSRKLSLIGLVIAMAAVLFIGAPAADAAPPNEDVNWSTCFRDVGAAFGVGYECSVVNLPLDYDRPNGATIGISVVRLPATDQANKIGSIFLNPGGPGGSGVEFALFYGPFAEFVWGPEVRARFDIVGFDPRGIGRSTALKCFGNLGQAVQVFSPFAWPETPDELALWAAGETLLDDQCNQRGNKVLEHMSTANVARDLDRLRAAVGDEQLTYVGLSYGTFLGVTYVNLFPDNVRSVIVDGVLDPVAWSNVEADIPFSTRLRSDEGAAETLDRFFELCDTAAPGNCALAPNSADRYEAIYDQLKANPIVFEDPFSGETFLIDHRELVGQSLGALYDPYSYYFLALMVAELEAFASPADIGFAMDRLAEKNGLVAKRGFPRYPNFVEGFPAVACEDTNNPADYASWVAAGNQAEADFGYFGQLWTWASGVCAPWSSVDGDAYHGPYDADTSNPVLVIGNLYDPATRYEGAQTVRGLLPNSGLLTVDVPGHTSLGLSGCAGFISGQYLLDPSVASAVDGFTCPAEFNPFDLVAESDGGEGFQIGLRARLLPEIAYRP
ncbi:MAG: alpha/beta hydrolase [Acidimicrobiia bacterium]|nr:alpha/beta hydrolase [Acidimicrobiia bacterium]